MILIALSVLGIISVPLAGGSLGRLAKLELRWLWAPPAALALQVLIVTIAPGPVAEPARQTIRPPAKRMPPNEVNGRSSGTSPPLAMSSRASRPVPSSS